MDNGLTEKTLAQINRSYMESPHESVLDSMHESYSKVRTTADFVKFMDECPDYWETGKFLASLSEELPSWTKIGSFSGDWQSDLNFEERKAYSDDKKVHSYYSVPAEYSLLKKFGYGHGYQIFRPTGKLIKMGQALDLESLDIQVNVQPPNSMRQNHYDNFVTFYREWCDESEENANHPWDLKARRPVGKDPIRIIVALQDWRPGWVWQFGVDHWSRWKAGDMITFEYRSTQHGTCNMSYYSRFLLRITGFVSEDSRWIRRLERPTINI